MDQVIDNIAFNIDNKEIDVSDEPKLSQDKIYEIKNILRSVKRLLDDDDDIKMSSIENDINSEKTKSVEGNLYVAKMFCSDILKTSEKLQINNDSFMFNSNLKGKSNSIIFFSDDFKYCFKEIRKNEFDKICLEAQRYAEYFNDNPMSLIAEIYGIFEIETDVVKYFIAMKNVLVNEHDVIFDLKGLGVVRNENEGINLDLDNSHRIYADEKIKNQLILDINFLSQTEVMDYSIIIGKTGDLVNIGIVDTLTEYGFYKKIERIYSLLFCESTGSSTNPANYAERMIKLVDQKLINKL